MVDYVPYTQEQEAPATGGYHHHEQKYQQRHYAQSRGISMLQIILFLIGVVMAFGFSYWFGTTYPDKLRSILITVDRFGFTQVGAAEQDRIRLINRLSATFEEKQVLINRTVFLDATQEMVSLALGSPVCFNKGQAEDGVPRDYWVYFIEGDSKPTRLTFKEGILESAGKASKLDSCTK